MKLKIFLIAMFFSTTSILAQQKRVTGTVSDDSGPLPGVTIIIKGTTVGTETDDDGKYSINVASNQVLIFSYLGFETVERTVGNLSKIDIKLKEAENVLDEIIVAFRSQKKEAITGATTKVDKAIIERVPVASLDQLFQGNSLGISATATNGNPGARSQVFIRGINSPTGGSEPIYILDGVRITAGDFRALNTGDLESFDILKDPSSTALYGARGSNGVILMTTKKGKKGEGIIEYEYSIGFSDLTDPNIEMMNALQYRQYRNILAPGTFSQQQLDEAANTSTNWRDVFFRSPIIQRHQLSFSGASDKINYYLSASYFNQEGILERSNLERSNVRVNLSGDVKSWLNVGTNISLGFTREDLADDFGVNTNSPVTQAFLNRPDNAAFNDDGTINNNQTFGFNAAEQTRINTDIREQTKFVGNLFGTATINENLSIVSNAGIDFREFDRNRFFRPGTNLGDQQNNGQLLFTNTRTFTININNQINYKVRFNDDNKLDLIAGMSFERFRNRTVGVDVQNFVFPDLDVIDGNATVVDATGLEDNATFVNYFFNADYNLKGRYFFTGSVSYSADSDFNVNNRFDWFYSAGFSWLLSDESFMENISWIDYAKVRASYGLTGNNQSAGLYSGLNTLATTQYNGNTGLISPFTFNDPSVSWEKVSGYNLGLDFELFDKRLKGTIEAYYKATTELAFQEPIASSTTITGGNGGVLNTNTTDYEVVNKGIEIQLTGDVIRNKDVLVQLGANYSYNRNEVNNRNGVTGIADPNLGSAWFGDGEAFGTWYIVRFAGVNPANGDALYYDADGNITNVYDVDNNSVILSGKSQYAPINGGFFGFFKYKGFELDARFAYQFDRYMSNNSRFFIENTNFPTFNQSVEMLNIWQQPGDITTIPRAGQGSQFDTRLLENASFVRLKTLTFSYNLPRTFADQIGLKSLRVYVQGQNLLTFTRYRGLDPETNARFDGFSYPVAKTFLLGLNVKL
jgi:TonB-linked SusC/RagA family outer membrane protein